MEEGCPSKDHGQLTGVVSTVQEAVVIVEIPRMVAAREPYNTVSGFSPYPGMKETNTFELLKRLVDIFLLQTKTFHLLSNISMTEGSR